MNLFTSETHVSLSPFNLTVLSGVTCETTSIVQGHGVSLVPYDVHSVAKKNCNSSPAFCVSLFQHKRLNALDPDQYTMTQQKNASKVILYDFAQQKQAMALQKSEKTKKEARKCKKKICEHTPSEVCCAQRREHHKKTKMRRQRVLFQKCNTLKNVPPPAPLRPPPSPSLRPPLRPPSILYPHRGRTRSAAVAKFAGAAAPGQMRQRLQARR